MELQIRTVAPARGWAWIVAGFLLFLRSPLQWLLLLAMLFVAKKVLAGFPVMALAAVFSVLVMLLMPVFMAGLMDGCRSLADGQRLKVTHLLQGFRRNAGNLVTIGGISLVGNIVILMVIAAIGGDAMTQMARALAANPEISPRVAGEMQAASVTVAKAALIGAALSLPLLMALWFAPLLAYFDDVKPLAALKLSLIACVKNTLPMLVYSLVLLAALIVLVPIGIRFREFDLGLWLMAPVLVPSIYASYRDIFRSAGEAVPGAPAPGEAQ
ncbi:MAG: hypothetical protein IT529_04150 [Burkholderiales bacterium]|nr:hypothetical protein [Burkholderiales bacterium]